ncbi:hypothetical protein [Mycolicibacterium aichiense]|uniref:Uncharacterized protein n=1 Tax=Mycolicibacterium aichiense TaxID=1799 RepID=A0AAD1HNI8_9MYCO|nr:hypothetical protein [Mycolicibacterium aichiense]MCV7019917.1 hypothetical protein [Mycolicibacterium aichiense]BBX07508.1 hypothetical protein MAIC_23110 [Mycolicibacterium aichiense]STZ81322.1 Uncharacterised protein [Mycolicibacterium aichiense]
MPGDLLRFVGGPTPYSSWWLWLAIILLAVIIVWYAAVFVVTLPNDRLRKLPAFGDLHARLTRRRFAGGIRRIIELRRRGELSDAQAYDQMSHTVRSFLHQATGVRAQYLHVDEIAAGALAPAAPLIAALRDARFDTGTDADPDRLGAQAEELIRSWI